MHLLNTLTVGIAIATLAKAYPVYVSHADLDANMFKKKPKPSHCVYMNDGK